MPEVPPPPPPLPRTSALLHPIRKHELAVGHTELAVLLFFSVDSILTVPKKLDMMASVQRWFWGTTRWEHSRFVSGSGGARAGERAGAAWPGLW